jgi:hypothetical protein
MANIFVTDLQIHRRFDIKGSTEGRSVGEEARRKAEGDPSVIFKVRGLRPGPCSNWWKHAVHAEGFESRFAAKAGCCCGVRAQRGEAVEHACMRANKWHVLTCMWTHALNHSKQHTCMLSPSTHMRIQHTCTLSYNSNTHARMLSLQLNHTSMRHPPRAHACVPAPHIHHHHTPAPHPSPAGPRCRLSPAAGARCP